MKAANLIIIGGFAGAGKTTLATKLSSKHNYPVFSSDVINDALRPVLHKDFHEVSPIAYEVMWYLVRKQLATGVTIIVDTHMSAPRVWESLDALKIEERGRSNKEHLNLGGDKLEDVLFKYDFIEKLTRPDVIRIDADKSREEVYTSVEKILHEHLPTL